MDISVMFLHAPRQENYLWGLVEDELFPTLQRLPHRPNVARLPLFYLHFQGNCLNELDPLAPQVQTFVLGPDIPRAPSRLLLIPFVFNL